jgi:hypothetical protein
VDTNQIISLLIAERDRLNAAISLLQGPMKRRGRPPKSASMPDWVTGNGATAPEPAPRKKRKFTAAQRKQQAERMKAYWATKKKAVAKHQSKAAKPKKTAKAA